MDLLSTDRRQKATVISLAGKGQRGTTNESQQFTKWVHGFTLALAFEPATCATADSWRLAAKPTSTGSMALKDCRSHPKALASLLPVPGADAEVRTSSAGTTFPLGEGSGILSFREVQSDCQDQPVGGHDNPSRCRAGHKQGRASHGKRKPIHDVVREVTSVRAHEVPLGR